MLLPIYKYRLAFPSHNAALYRGVIFQVVVHLSLQLSQIIKWSCLLTQLQILLFKTGQWLKRVSKSKYIQLQTEVRVPFRSITLTTLTLSLHHGNNKVGLFSSNLKSWLAFIPCGATEIYPQIFWYSWENSPNQLSISGVLILNTLSPTLVSL